jgi:hypothetical protein
MAQIKFFKKIQILKQSTLMLLSSPFGWTGEKKIKINQ